MNDVALVADSCIFGFESELERSLEFIPLTVRFKLDKCAVKISLEQWREFSAQERQMLLEMPCEEHAERKVFVQNLELLAKSKTGDGVRSFQTTSSQSWEGADVPEQVRRQTMELGLAPPTPSQWQALTALQRYVLVKLCREGGRHRNLVPALKEFDLHG